ncbi:hypothetical protein Syun_013619 [Stephania yunnanensis]|uniref:Annexin n=1 Tax=Stephania yunnanensis TaxID=152371 RepID=A0AAP0P8U7_9MAGN
MSTLTIPSDLPSVAEDCEQLKKAFDGWGTNEKLIISILAHRTSTQRKLIRQAYAELFGVDLLQSLDKELSSDFEKVVLLWTVDPAERDAILAHDTARKWHPNNRVLLEIACTRSSLELFAVKQAYHARFKRSLEEDVAYHTTGDFRKLLVPLVSSFRYEGPEVNMTLAKTEAKILHENISNKAYNHDDIIRILTTRSKPQLNATFNHYNNEFGMLSDLKTDPEDGFLAALRAIIKCLTNPEKYFEKVLRLAINKTGTDEIDMKQIKEEYYRRNSVPLERAIAHDTSGDYEAMLLALIGHEDA